MYDETEETEEETRKRLTLERLRKLEATLQTYDACLNTNMIDWMRKRIDLLERGMEEILRGDISDSVRRSINVILSNKFPQKY